MNLLEIKKISKRFGGVKAVDTFSMSVPQDTIYGIIGPNGAGKTTIFNLISGIYKPDEGRIFLQDRDISNLNQQQIAALGISRTFQNIRLFSGLNVLDNVKIAQDYFTGYGLLQALINTPKVHRIESQLETEAFNHLRLLNLENYAFEKPENLPYGVQRKLEIARALSRKPKLMLLDEPAAGLNPEEAYELIGFIRNFQKSLGLTIIIIEHRMDVIMRLCKQIYVQDFGVNIAIGSPQEIQNNSRVRSAYLGEVNQ